jgi:DNA polymerase-3 subunit gamma/tau
MSESAPSAPYIVFARRWRPRTFDEVVGQDHISQQLKNAVESGRVGHAFLFRGPRGVGKTSMARILAKALNCEKGPTTEPCGSCSHCRNIASGSAMDVIEIDAATHTQVDQMREILATVNYTPAAMRHKIYIVDEVHMLSRHAFNALLKTLEEPPAAVKFIFATTDAQRIPETIRSRCQDFEFRRISTDDITRRLDHILTQESGVEVAEDERTAILEALARHAEGGMRDAQVALDQLISLSSGRLTLEVTRQLLGAIENRVLLDTVRALQAGDTARLLAIVDALVESGSDLETYVKSLMQFVRDLLVLRAAPGREELTDIPSTWMEEIRAIVPGLDLAMLLNLGNNLFTLLEQMKSLAHTRFLIEFFFIKLTTVGSHRGVEEVLRALESGETLPGAGPADAPSAAPMAASAEAAGPDPLASPPAPVAKVFKTVADPSDPDALWRALTGALWGKDMRMKTYLERGRPISVDDDVLVVGIPEDDKFYLGRLRRPENTQKITELLEGLTKKTWQVRFVNVGNTVAPRPRAVAAAPVADGDREEVPAGPESAPAQRPAQRAAETVRATDLLDQYPFLRHLHQQFQCTGIRLVPPASEPRI